MKRLFTIMTGAIVGLSVSLPTVSANDWPDAHKRRAFQLGMTLSEFRATKHPDQKQWPNAFPVCSNDFSGASSDYSDLNAYKSYNVRYKLGVIMCEHAYKSGEGRYALIMGAGLMLADTPSSTNYFFAVPEGKTEPVLYRINSGGPAGDFSHVYQTFLRGMGEPDEIREETLQNGLGNSFTNRIATYHSSSSQIILKSFGDNLRVFSVTHLLNEVYLEVSDKVKALEGDPADRL